MADVRTFSATSAAGLLVVACVLTGCTSPGGISLPTGPAAPAGGMQPKDDPEPADGAAPAGASAISLTGAAEGDVSDAVVDCTALESIGAWTLTGALDGELVELTFNSNSYDGPGTYNATGISDPEGGLMTLRVGEGGNPSAQVVTNGDTPGTFTVDDGGETGSVDAVLLEVDQEVTVVGTWACD